MSSFGTATTVERIDQIGPGESSPGLVFRATGTVRLLGFSFLWPRRRSTVLCVDDLGLTATGNFGAVRRGTLHLPWSRVQELHYAPGGNGEIGGLYAREGAWCSRCLLPGLAEPQADDVIAVVASRYPWAVPFSGDDSHLAAFGRHHQSAPPTAWTPRWTPVIQPPR